MKNILSTGLLLSFGAAFLGAATYQVDSAHSSAQFAVRHMMVSTVRGDLAGIKGKAEFDAANPAQSWVEVTIDVATLNTREPKRDAHLKSADFFDAEKFPTITFRSRKVESAGAGKLKITGDLTLRGVTREVVLDVEGPTPEMKDARGGGRMGAAATTRVNRKDFGLQWNRALDGGGVVVGDEVSITIDIELIRRPAAQSD